MAQSQHVAPKHHRARHRHQTRSPSPSRHNDWDSRHPPIPHSLPYRAREPKIQRQPVRRPNNYYHSHPGAQLSSDEDIDVPDPMPHPQQQLTRPAAVGPRNGKGRAVFLEVEEEDDDDNDRMISRLRSRSRPRTSRTQSRAQSRARSKARSLTSSGDDETFELPTPPRSTPAYNRSRPTSRLPSPSSSRSSSDEDTESTSTEEERIERLKRRARRRPAAVPVTPPAPPAAPPAIDRTDARRNHRRPRDRSAYRTENSDTDSDTESDDAGYKQMLRLRARSKSLPRPRPQTASRSTSRRRHHHRGQYDDGEPSSSSKRPAHRRRYYESDVPYEKPSLPRAHTAPSSHVAAHSLGLQSPPDKHSKMVECVVCLDDLPSKKTAKLKCGHRMCQPCLKRSFKLSVKDPAQMPPRCCTSDCIPLKHVDDLFDIDFKKTWNRKFHEFSTRNRVYCPGKRCGQWITPDQIQRHRNGRKVGKCGSCGTKVCCECNSKWHGSSPCQADEDVNQILQQAKEEGWQRCYNCRNMVELKEGCNHMTCRCGAEFCMICGLKWKSCECPWFPCDGVEPDPLDHMQIPEPIIDRERLNLRSAPAGAGMGMGMGMDARRRSPGNGLRSRANTYEQQYRRFQEQQDEELARKLQFEDTEDDYMDPADGLEDAEHFNMNRNYGRRARTVIAPPAPAPPPVAPFERTNSVADYVTGVNKARGFRASSMERRLADRFEQRQAGTSTPHAFGQGIPPPPAPPRAMGPPPVSQPLGSTPMMRRHNTMDDDFFDGPRASRHAERMLPRRATTRSYIEEPTHYDPAAYEAGPRIRRRERAASTSPKDSVLAGLNGPGRGMHRVYEWVSHVEPNMDPSSLMT